ncbi:hypothetical protein E1267_10900 [Nonomuraea longispora]|uniref:Uncharacterized protein n=1 Tax=Nonomuraea longispora TaxID=1848320 RepID=A0A4R4NKL9_9ACTN|nr:DUF6782 family putative metallopeptidase [Nonomuraea longispora]TDC08260.1 hypothetical protein E1267_10900 [Nonomuraea longispora]
MELPPHLASVHDLVKDVAPLGLPDEEERMKVARSWVDLGLELHKSSGEVESAARRAWTANKGGDVTAFQASWEDEHGPGRRLEAGGKGALLTGLGTMAIVILRVVWKAYVTYVVAILAASLLASLAAGPASTVIRYTRVMGARRTLTQMRTKFRQQTALVVRDTLHRARMLAYAAAPVFAAPVFVSATNLWGLGTLRSNEEAQRLTEEVLRETPAGRAALAYAKDHGITVVYQGDSLEGALGGYTDALNVIALDYAGRTPEQLAEVFVHEVNHARTDGDPYPIGMDRDEYVKAAIEEEVDGEVKAHEMRMQLAAARGEPEDWSSDYGFAYKDAVGRENDQRQQQHLPPLSAEAERRVGDEAGREALREWARSAGYEEQFEQQWKRRYLRPVADAATPDW